MFGRPNGGGIIFGGRPGALVGKGGGPSLGTSCGFSTGGGGGIGGKGATISWLRVFGGWPGGTPIGTNPGGGPGGAPSKP